MASSARQQRRSWRAIAKSIIAFCWLGVATTAYAEWYRDDQNIMGTRISVELWHEDATVAKQAIADVMADMRRIDRLMSPWIETSELYLINHQAAKQPVTISEELFRLLETSQYYSKLSGGAFDITFASVGFFYDYRAGIAPSEQQLRDNLDAIDYRAIELDPEKFTVYFTKANTKIDLGGIAKGYAVDLGVELLKKAGIVSGLVSAGGDTRVIGDRWGKPWTMGIRHPRKDDKNYAVVVPIVDGAISTSGDYERFFMRGEERVHHILSPATGKSVLSMQSVSILAATATQSDALTKTVFVLGVERGLAFINRLEGVDAIIIDADGKLHYSANLLRAEQK